MVALILRVITSLIFIIATLQSIAGHGILQIYYVDVLVTNDSLLNELNKFEKIIISEKFNNPYIYNADIYNPLTINEFVQKIAWMDSIHAVKTDSIRIYFKASNNLHQIYPIAFTRLFSIESRKQNKIHNKSQPIFAVPIGRVKKFIPNEGYYLLCQKTSELLINAIKFIHYENGLFATNIPVSAGHPLLDFEIINHNSVIDFYSKNDLYKLKYTRFPNDNLPINQNEIVELFTTKDSILTNLGYVIETTDNKISDLLFSFFPQISIEMSEDQFGFMSYAKIDLTSEYIGFCTEHLDKKLKNCIWTKKSELFPSLNNNIFIQGLTFFESHSILQKIQKN